MEHLPSLEGMQLGGSVLTIGSFDGVHVGHQALIRSTVETAHRESLSAVVLTFFPHPSVILRGRKPAFYITSPEERAGLLGKMGVDYVVTQTFDQALAVVSPDAFLDRLQAHLGLRHLWVGEDFALGYRRQGNVPFLEKSAVERGFTLHVHEPVMVGGEVVSSTRVREALRAGDVARAATYLGRPFVIPGRVILGAGRGKSLNLPTANLEIWEERACPGPGVYACFAAVRQEQHKAVANIGVRPTFEGDGRTTVVEAHLLDFEGDLYGEEMRLTFIERLRDERRFAGPEALLEQVDRDILRARVILNSRAEVSDG